MKAFRTFATSLSKGGEFFIEKELKYGAHNYHPIPVVISKGSGVHLYDVGGKQYLDFLAGYSAVNQGHCHPNIVEALVQQASTLTTTSRAFHNNLLGQAEEYLCSIFNYEKALLMNSGVEAVDSAVKIARRWAYEVKGVPDNEAVVLFPSENFWGRSISACASSDDPDRYKHFGPFGGLNFEIIPYDDVSALEKALENPNVAAFIMEPIQGEAGVKLPKDGYLKKVRELTKKKNVLMVADEIQVGIGRCGKLLACDWENVRPDMVTLAKSLSGGLLPISAVLADSQVMDVLVPGSHGSTFGGNPLACKVLQAALDVVFEEGLIENSLKMGELFRKGLEAQKEHFVADIRGKGLMNAIEIETKGFDAWDVCIKLAENGLLSKPTHGNIIRFTPPLVIKEKEVHQALDIIHGVLREYK